MRTNPPLSQARPSASFGALFQDIVAFGRWRLARLAVLAILAAAAEGVGLFLLVPMLQFLGIVGSGVGAATWHKAPVIGLEGALAAYVLLVAAGALVVAIRGTTVAAFRSGYADDLRRRLHHAVLAMEWRSFNGLRTADIQHCLTADTARAAYGVDFLLRLACWAVEIPVLLAVALRLSPTLTGASLALAGLCLVLTRPLNRQSQMLGHQLGVSGRRLQAKLTDDLAGMRVIRSLGLEAQRRQAFDCHLTETRSALLAQQRLSGLARAATQALAATVAALAIWLAVSILGMALADTLVLMIAFARLLMTSLQVQEAWRMVLHSLPAHGAVSEMLARCHASAEPTFQEGNDLPRFTLGLTIEDATFGYRADVPPVLNGVCAIIPPLAVTALVGSSGAGKSTLADLLLGLITPDKGRVLVDGQPLAGPLRQAWRRRVGYVPQDAFLFHDTVRANLLVANPQADEVHVWATLEQAAAADFVRALPEGLDTMVGDRGSQLSGGQRQRLALARALLTRPDLLILDEATSALDGENERRVLDVLEELRGQLTIVVIAHRPSTVHRADHVIVLDAGRVVATGPWTDVSAMAKPLLQRLTLA